MINKKDEVVRDGQVVRVPIMLMDASQRQVANRKPSQYGHRPGGMPLTDTERGVKAARQAAKDQVLSERWRKPANVAERTR